MTLRESGTIATMSMAFDDEVAPEWIRTAHDAADLLLGERPGVLLVGAPSHTRPVVGFILDRLSASPLSPVPFTAAEATSDSLREAVERSQAAQTAPGNALLLVIRDAESLSPALLDELELAATAAAEHGGLKFLFAARHELAPTLRRAGHVTLSEQLRTRLLIRAPMRSPETDHVADRVSGPVLATRHAVSRDMHLPGILLAGSVLAALALTFGIAHQLLHRRPAQLAQTTLLSPLPIPVRPNPPVAAAPQRQAVLLPAVPPVASVPVASVPVAPVAASAPGSTAQPVPSSQRQALLLPVVPVIPGPTAPPIATQKQLVRPAFPVPAAAQPGQPAPVAPPPQQNVVLLPAVPTMPVAAPGQRSPPAAVLPPPEPGTIPPPADGPGAGRVASPASSLPTATQTARPTLLTPSPQQQAVLLPTVPAIPGVPAAPLTARTQPASPVAVPRLTSGTVDSAPLPAQPGGPPGASSAPPPPTVAPPVQAPRGNQIASSTPRLPAVAQPGQVAQQPTAVLPAAPESPSGSVQDRHVAPAPVAASGPIPLHSAGPGPMPPASAGPAQTVQPAARPAVRQQALPSPAVPANPGVAAVPDVSRQAAALSAAAPQTSRTLPAGAGAPSAPPSGLSPPAPERATQLALAVPSHQPATLPPADPQPDQPAASAGQKPAAFVPLREPVSKPSASLLILAGPGDTLSSLYRDVYRGTIPPAFSQVAALNRVRVHAGTRLIFPSPPRGWPKQSQSRR